MADEQHVIRGISWTEVFSFTHLFKSFKMAVHPSKIVLALVAILLSFVLGLVMDAIWGGVSANNRVVKDEAWVYWLAPSHLAFKDRKDQWIERERVTKLQSMLSGYGEFRDAGKMARDNFNKAADQLADKLLADYNTGMKKLQDKYAQMESQLPKEQPDHRLAAAQNQRDRRTEEAALLQKYVSDKQSLEQLQGAGIFESLYDWQRYCVSNAIASLRRGNVLSGVSNLMAVQGTMTPGPYRVLAVPNVPEFDAATNNPEGVGVVGWLIMMAWSLFWLVSVYPTYGVIWILLTLSIWAIFGGAICRIAALHSAREEKISLAAAMKFSLGKFFSFLTAPLLPILLVLFLGLLMSLGGVVGSIKGLGEWLIALLFFIPLILGAVMAFLLVGLVGGWPLMWPTIAVEGSDSFDAISRSYSYIYARPFRYVLYLLVAGFYGAICYLFVRLFAFVALVSTHTFVGWAMSLAHRDGYAPGAGKLDVMWAQPTFETFRGPIQSEAMTGSEAAASHVLAFWVYLVSWIVLAFLLSFFFSAATNIYFLLRRKVDATDLDDVYVEEEEHQPLPPTEQTTVMTVETKTTDGQTIVTLTPPSDEPKGEETTQTP